MSPLPSVCSKRVNWFLIYGDYKFALDISDLYVGKFVYPVVGVCASPVGDLTIEKGAFKHAATLAQWS